MHWLTVVVTSLAGGIFAVILLGHVWVLLFPAQTLLLELRVLFLLAVLLMVLLNGLFKLLEFYKFRGLYASKRNFFEAVPHARAILLFVPYWGVLLGLVFLKIVEISALGTAFFVYGSVALLLYSHYIFPIVLTHQRQK